MNLCIKVYYFIAKVIGTFLLLNFQVGQAHAWRPDEEKNLTQITITISWKVEPELIK